MFDSEFSRRNFLQYVGSLASTTLLPTNTAKLVGNGVQIVSQVSAAIPMMPVLQVLAGVTGSISKISGTLEMISKLSGPVYKPNFTISNVAELDSFTESLGDYFLQLATANDEFEAFAQQYRGAAAKGPLRRIIDVYAEKERRLSNASKETSKQLRNDGIDVPFMDFGGNEEGDNSICYTVFEMFKNGSFRRDLASKNNECAGKDDYETALKISEARIKLLDLHQETSEAINAKVGKDLAELGLTEDAFFDFMIGTFGSIGGFPIFSRGELFSEVLYSLEGPGKDRAAIARSKSIASRILESMLQPPASAKQSFNESTHKKTVEFIERDILPNVPPELRELACRKLIAHAAKFLKPEAAAQFLRDYKYNPKLQRPENVAAEHDAPVKERHEKLPIEPQISVRKIESANHLSSDSLEMMEAILNGPYQGMLTKLLEQRFTNANQITR